MENFQRRTQNKKITLHQYRTVQQNIWKLPKKEKETKRRLKGRCDMGKRKSFFLANLSVPHFERISSLKLKWQDFWRFDNMLQEINCGCDSQLSIRFTEQKKRGLHLISHTINYEQSIHLTHFSNNHKREIEVETRLVDLLTGRKKKILFCCPCFR